MSKGGLFAVSLSVILAVSFIIYMRSSEPATYKPGIWPEADAAVSLANDLYKSEKERGRDFSDGPCLSNSVYHGWVLDLVHNPRQPVDELPQNQCDSYKSGSAKHFVELDLEGNLVRVK